MYHTQNQLKIEDLRCETVKLLEGERGEKLKDMGCANDNMTSKAQAKRQNKWDHIKLRGFPGGSGIKNLQCRRREFDPLGWEDPLEKGMATHSNIPAWRIPWTVACHAPQSMEFSRQDYWSG